MEEASREDKEMDDDTNSKRKSSSIKNSGERISHISQPANGEGLMGNRESMTGQSAKELNNSSSLKKVDSNQNSQPNIHS